MVCISRASAPMNPCLLVEYSAASVLRVPASIQDSRLSAPLKLAY